jgi:hypothetical protein
MYQSTSSLRGNLGWPDSISLVYRYMKYVSNKMPSFGGVTRKVVTKRHISGGICQKCSGCQKNQYQGTPKK